MAEISLCQMLEARDKRAALQKSLLNQFHAPLISFTMNIPGPIKRTPAIERAFRVGCTILEKELPPSTVLHREYSVSDTGCQAFYAVKQDAFSLKKCCTAIEDSFPLGRLFDMDVLHLDGRPLERSLVGGKSRDCIVCGAQGRNCSSRRLHTVEQLQSAVNGILTSYFSAADAAHVAALATQSLLDEVATTPKPGLVDRNNCGSHTDMDFSTFVASAHVLEPFFRRCVEIGQETTEQSFEETFALLRIEGLRAEEAMYQATHGVNTHKGAIYTMGTLCGAIGRCWNLDHPISPVNELLACCARLAHSSVHEDFSQITQTEIPRTTGEQLYLAHKLTGVRGELAAGLPSVANIGLPAFLDALHHNHTPNDAGAIALLHLISHVADTNLYRRGGTEGSQYAADSAAALLKSTPYPTYQQILELDTAFISRNLSPGGCADLLAIIYFLHALEQEAFI